MHSVDYLIIGSSAAGIATATTLKRIAASASVLCITQEAEEPYNKCLLADIASGTRPWADVYTRSTQELSDLGITLWRECKATELDAKHNIVTTARGQIHYKKLMLATGTIPFVPPSLNKLQNTYYFHTLHNVTALLHALKSREIKQATIAGTGLSGLEAADVLASHGIQPTLVERASGILPRHLTPKIQRFLTQRLQAAGVIIYTDSAIAQVQEENAVTLLTLADHTITTPLLVIATGAQAAAQELLRNTDIHHENGFIIVDQEMRTNNSDIFAAGDAVITRNRINGLPSRSMLWPDAVQQGIVAAYTMIGTPKIYRGVIPMVSSRFFDIKLVSCGIVAQDASIARIEEDITGNNAQARVYDAQGDLIGFILIGDNAQLPALRKQLRLVG